MDTTLILKFLIQIIEIYSYTLLIYALMSWLPDLRQTRIYEFFYNVTHPYLRLFKFARVGMLDLSIIVGFFVLNILSIILRSMM
ncbi:YggT family protein [Haloplasma contractile]|uniref:Integral membrane protein n=1 Tax=Haloplasma contractile SSD-17B TaxID=1033810 RepID=U2EG68_9MOLU|nr:Integral membrane protein [Haloplasma contractile SSD-17B]